MPSPNELSSGTRSLRVELTQEELLKTSYELAEAIEEQEAAEAERKSAVKHFQAVEEAAASKSRALRTLLRNGYDYRPVVVTVLKDYDKKLVVTTRDDTMEVIETREMTQVELQTELT